MNTDHSGESSSEHSLDPFIRPIGNLPGQEPVSSGEDRERQMKAEGELRADETHQDESSKASKRGPIAHTSRSEVESSSTSETSAFVFRVDCPGSPPQRLQLTGELYTLGTADGCSIRLRDSNVLPLHATIRHTSESVFVESHSRPLIINGQAYERRELQNGDILSLGGYRFELISNHRVQSPSTERPTLTNVLPPDVERALARSTNPREQQGSADKKNLQDIVAQSRLQDCLRRERLCEKREAKIADDIAELKYREEELLKRIARLEAEEASSLEIYDQLSKRQAEINSLRSSLQETQALNLTRETELQKAKSELEKQLAECLEASEAVLGKHDSDSRTIEQLNTKIGELQAALNDTQQQRDLLELREQLQRREHEQLVRQLEKDRDRVIAEKARNQAQLRKMEVDIRDLESLVASANDLEATSPEVDESFEPNPEQSTPLADITEIQSPQEPSEARTNSIPVLDLNQSTLEQLDRATLEEFTELSQRNASLLTELMELKRDRDRCKIEAANESSEQISDLERALSSASSELAKTRADYAEAKSLLEKMDRQKEIQKENRAQKTNRSGDDHDDSDPGMGATQEDIQTSAGNPESTNQKQKPSSRISPSWNSLLGDRRQSSGEKPKAERDQTTGTIPSAKSDETDPSTSQHQAIISDLSGDGTESGWFQSGRQRSVEKQQSKPMGCEVASSTKPVSTNTLNNGSDEDLFISGSHLAVSKATRAESLNETRDEAMLWNRGRHESIESPEKGDKERLTKAVAKKPTPAVKTPEIATVAEPKSITESKSITEENSIKESETVDPLPTVSLESSASDSIVLCESVEDEPRETIADQNLALMSQGNERITKRLINSIRTLFFSEGDTINHSTTSDQAILTRYAFAFAAVMAGLVCYRLVPGQVRYLAVFMALVLAAIYTTEGVTMAKSRAAR